MNSKKLIMEGWKKFLKESRAPVVEIDGKQICLYYHSKRPPGFSIVLYIVDPQQNRLKGFKVIAGIDCVTTEDPCIPKTLQVGTSYRHSDYTGKGLGPLVYDLAFFVAQSMGYGLTSDRETGSKPKARNRWSKIEADPNYEKQKTSAGNDKFDYRNNTPDDPDDDCTKDLFDTNATDHSFIKKDVGQIHSTLMELEANHLNHLENIPEEDRDDFLMNLRLESTNLFHDEYDLAETKMTPYKLHENFRKFINEGTDFDPSKTCLILKDFGNEKMIVLYNPKKLKRMSGADIRREGVYGEYEIIGAIKIKNSKLNSKKPCIPETYEIATIYVNKQYRGKGYQKMLMDLAFFVASKEGAGLTSDHKHGTTPAAAGAWKKIEKSSVYKKKETKAGNDTFDYNDSTPDPDDDCQGHGMKNDVATDHSFERTSVAGAELKYDSYAYNHKKIFRHLKMNAGENQANNLVNVILRMAGHEFNQAYHHGM